MRSSASLRLPFCLLALGSALALCAQTPQGNRRAQRPPDAPPPVPAGVTAHRDLAYVTNGHTRQKLDLYVPDNAATPLPLIVWIHGGGWASGSKSGCPPLRAGFTARGYAVASLDYRLSGDAIFPAQVEDCKAALRWLRAHAKQYNLDPDHIGVWGSSAGGHLVAFLGTSGDTKEFDVGENLEFSSGVQAVGDYYGPTDFVQMDAHAFPGTRLIHDSPTSPEARFIGGPIQDEANRPKVQRANPITYVTKNDAPFMIVHGDSDPAVPHHQSELLYAALVKAGVPVRFITVKGGGHGQGFPGDVLNPIATEFFDRHLQGKTDAANWPVAMTSEVAATSTGRAPDAPEQTPVASTGPAARTGSGQRRGPPSFEQLLRNDSNGDGRVSRSEWKGPAPLFDRLDRDSNDFITRDEHPAAAASEAQPMPTPAPEPSAPKPAEPVQGVAAESSWQANTATSPDGTKIDLLWNVPAGAGPFPVVMFFHGAPGGIGEPGLRRIAVSSRWSRFLAAGFAVCLGDYRAHPAGQPFAVLKGEVNATDDVAAIVKFLSAQPALDISRLAIMGGSLGGVTTLQTVSSGKIAPRCIVLNAPASFPFLGVRGRREQGAALTDADIDKPAALQRLETVRCPVLLVQGTGDALTPINQMLHSLMVESGKNVRLELFENESHSFTNGPDTEAYRRALELSLTFIQQHTTPPGAATRPPQVQRASAALPAPTHANVSYGTHERHVFDLWLAKSGQPTPLVLFLHGGGFISGSKEQLNPEALQKLLAAGISVAAVNYRLVSHATLPAAQQDAARALQFLRAKAAEWNIDKTRIGAFGGSAGAQLTMYLAFHDDLAENNSPDPIARESTRLTCSAPTAGQCTMDFDWWVKNVPGYDKPMRDTVEIFGAKSREEAVAKDREISARFLITKDDPPIYMSYAMAPGQPYPDDKRTTMSWKIHHIVHGLEIKRLCDEAGVEAVLSYPGANPPYATGTDFLVAKLSTR